MEGGQEVQQLAYAAPQQQVTYLAPQVLDQAGQQVMYVQQGQEEQQQVFVDANGQEVQYVMQAPQQQVVYAVAPQQVADAAAAPGGYTLAQPAGQVTYIQQGGEMLV